MSLLLVMHTPETSEAGENIPHFIAWDNGKHEPYKESTFMTVEELKPWFLENAPQYLGQLPQWIKLCTISGVGHMNKIVTPERVFAKTIIADGRLTPVVAWEMFKPSAKKKEVKATKTKPKETQKKPTASKKIQAGPSSTKSEKSSDQS